MKFIGTITAVMCAAAVYAVALNDDVSVDENGKVKFPGGEIGFGIHTHGFSNGLDSERIKERKVSDSDANLKMTAKGDLGSIPVNLEENVTAGKARNAFNLSYDLRMPSTGNVQISFVDLRVAFDDVRTVIADGRTLRLPLEQGEKIEHGTRTLTFVLVNGKTLAVHPKGVWYVDNRRFGQQTCSFRLEMARGKNDFSCNFEFTLGAVGQKALDLTPYANRDFKDEVPGDDKGGWTDQGPGNDLRMIKPGSLTFGGITYSVIDAAKNNGKGVIVLAGDKRSATLPRAVEIDLGENVTARGMSLLHACAWSLTDGDKSAEIEVQYADGTTSVHELVQGRDILNWAGCRLAPNAQPAFKSWNIVCDVGLYASHFELAKPNPRKLRLRLADPDLKKKGMTTRDLMWLVAGITLTDVPVSFKAYDEKPYKIEGKDWIPLTFKSTPVPGSALDFSFVVDAPAGKHGAATCTSDGHFTFANGKKMRFYGANLCQLATVIAKEDSDALATRLARTGYTTVRFHHFETRLVDQDAKTSLDISPEKLDLFFYQFAAMKKAGLYVILDLYASRELKPGEIPGYEDVKNANRLPGVKALLPISDAYLENYKAFCRKLYTTANPYTGMTLADDPALIAVNMVNEDNLNYYWANAQAAWEKEFADYCAKHPQANPKPFLNNRDFVRFIHLEKHLPFYQKVMKFCKEELKMKAALTSLAMEHHRYLALLTQHFDWIDKHCYYSHPVPARGNSGSQIPNANSHPGSPIDSFGQPSPFEIMCTRYAGKPFGSTEWNFCFPNPYRHEGTAMFAYYAALHDWDLLCRFQWACGPWNLNDKIMVCSAFDAASDPVMQLSERIAAALYTRGDASVSPRKYVQLVPKNLLETSEPTSVDSVFHSLGRIAEIGLAVEGDAIPDGWTVYKGAQSVHPDDAKLLREATLNRAATSATREMTLDAKKHTLRIVTPRTEVVSAKAGEMSGSFMSAKEISGVQTIAAISRSEKALAESDDIVLIHLTDVQNSEALFNNDRMIIQETWGKLPVCVRRETAQVTLRTTSPRKVLALGPDGDIRGEVKATWQDGQLSFNLDPGAFDGGIMAYHIVK